MWRAVRLSGWWVSVSFSIIFNHIWIWHIYINSGILVRTRFYKHLDFRFELFGFHFTISFISFTLNMKICWLFKQNGPTWFYTIYFIYLTVALLSGDDQNWKKHIYIFNWSLIYYWDTELLTILYLELVTDIWNSKHEMCLSICQNLNFFSNFDWWI